MFQALKAATLKGVAKSLCIAAGLMLAASFASATTFDVSAVVGNNQTTHNAGAPTGLTFTGTLEINTVAGTLDSGSLALQSDPNVFTNFFGCPTAGSCTFYFNTGFAEFGLLSLTNSGTLVGYTGGAVLPGSYIDTNSVAYDLTGTVTPRSELPSAVPEPGTVGLLLSGMSGLGALVRRKRA